MANNLKDFQKSNHLQSIDVLSSITTYDFKTASNEVLKFLQKRIGFDLWMLTRAEGLDWIILQAEDNGYGIKSPTVLKWADSFCVQMVKGNGPQCAPRSDWVPAYTSAPIAKQLKIGAYIGVPLTSNNGILFGTLCAIHPEPQPDSIKEDLPIVKLLSQLLSGLLHAEQEINKQIRLTERAEIEALNDPVRGCYNPLIDLYNSNGWWQLLDAEESRCEIYGSPTWVVLIQTDDDLIVKNKSSLKKNEDLTLLISRTIYEVTYPEDIIAQIEDKKFAILVVESNSSKFKLLLERLDLAFSKAGILNSIGYAKRHPEKGLRNAWQMAEEALNREITANELKRS